MLSVTAEQAADLTVEVREMLWERLGAECGADANGREYSLATDAQIYAYFSIVQTLSATSLAELANRIAFSRKAKQEFLDRYLKTIEKEFWGSINRLQEDGKPEPPAGEMPCGCGCGR